MHSIGDINVMSEKLKIQKEKEKSKRLAMEVKRSAIIEKSRIEFRKVESRAFIAGFAAWIVAIFVLVLVWNALSRGSFEDAKDIFDSVLPIAALIIGHWFGALPGREREKQVQDRS